MAPSLVMAQVLPGTEPKPARHPETYRSVQALRGIAALIVTLFHAAIRLDTAQTTFRIGNAGVDIFFVISGFVIWTVTIRRPVRPLEFLKHRFVRLVPMYWILTLAMAAGTVAIPSAFPRMQPTFGDVMMSLAFVPHVSPSNGTIEPILGQGWTLNFEVFFYLVFAAVLLLPGRMRAWTMTVTLLILPVLGLALATPAIPATTLLDPLLFEFLGGVCIARVAAGSWRPPAAWCGSILVVGIGLLLIAAPPSDDDWARVLQYGGPAVLIVAGAVGLEAAGRLRVPAWMSLLGAASYSLYLTHTFVLSLLAKLWSPDLPVWIFMVAAGLLAAMIGTGVYLLVERRILALMRGGRNVRLVPN